MRALGLDLSLTSSGWAVADDTGGRQWGVITDGKTLRGAERLAAIFAAHVDLLDRFRPHVVAVEGYSYASPQGGHQLGELGGVVRLLLHSRGVPFASVTPGHLKGFATGKGGGKGATKDTVMAAARQHLGWGGTLSDEADALMLATMALVAYRAVDCPLPDPEARTGWADRVAWPALDRETAGA